VTVRELIDIVNTYGVSVEYFGLEKLKEIIFKRSSVTSPIYFAAVDEKERKRFEASKDKSKFGYYLGPSKT
jgi:hypothetical protein